MKVIKTANYEKSARTTPEERDYIMQEYKTDADIASEFSDMQIRQIEVNPSGQSGFIEAVFPQGEEHVGGGTKTVTDNWIRYDDGRIAFDHWYPTTISDQLVNAINEKLKSVV